MMISYARTHSDRKNIYECIPMVILPKYESHRLHEDSSVVAVAGV